MRKLIYVPVIHTSADLGSLAKIVAKRGIADLGENVWKKYRETVEGFWDVISDYFDLMYVADMKIYQDGMIADGEMGTRIVEDTAKAGSKNYELVSRLLKRGAFLVKTEEFTLVKKERDRIFKMTHTKTIFKKLFNFIIYKLTKDILLNKRDKFIAKRINETLSQGETGIIFIGAYHNIKKRLLKDIQITQIKNADKIREYQRLLPFYNKNKERFEELSRYLVLKINSA